MSIESFSPLPLNIFGTWVTLLDASDVPAGMSPSLGDVEFFPGGVRTRAGLVSQFTPLAGVPQINGGQDVFDDEPGAEISGARFFWEYLQGNFAGSAVAGRFGRGSEFVYGFDHAVRARVHGVFGRFGGARHAAAIRRFVFGSSEPDRAGRGSSAGGCADVWKYIAGRASVLGDFRDAAGILHGAIASGDVDGGGIVQGERDEHSDRAIKRDREAAGIHGERRGQLSTGFTQGPPYGAVVYYARTAGLDGNGNAVFSVPALAASTQITPGAPTNLTVTVK